MAKLVKVFFGLIDTKRVLKSGELDRGFWGFEEDFVRLDNPINWEHGVLQHLSINDKESWVTLTGNFRSIEDFSFTEIKIQLTKVHPHFKILSDLIELITFKEGDLIDVIDEFQFQNMFIEEEIGGFINLKNFEKLKSLKENSIWVFEVLKYNDVNYTIESNSLYPEYDSSEDLNLIDRFSFGLFIEKLN